MTQDEANELGRGEQQRQFEFEVWSTEEIETITNSYKKVSDTNKPSLSTHSNDKLIIEFSNRSEIKWLYEWLSDQESSATRRFRYATRKVLESLTLLGKEFDADEVPNTECFAYPNGYGSGASGTEEYKTIDELSEDSPSYSTDSVHQVVLEKTDNDTYRIIQVQRFDTSDPTSNYDQYEI